MTLFMRIPELSPERYDVMMTELGLDATPPAGLILHQATEGVGAVNVCEIWQTEQAATAFVDRVLREALARNGVRDPLSFRLEPLHNLFVPGMDVVERIGNYSVPDSRRWHVS